MQSNTQAPEGLSRSADGSVELHHAFLTIQGEGPFTGRRAVFLRLAGCNLQCPGCDTEYTSRRTKTLPDEIVEHCARLAACRNCGQSDGHLVVITGGEPFRQNLTPMIWTLIERGFRVQVETNGTLWQDAFPFHARCTVVCSPKTSTIHPTLALRANAFKYVIQAGKVDIDGLPWTALESDQRPARPPRGHQVEIFVSPFDQGDANLNRLNAAAAVESCMKFGYRLSLQTHKIVNLE